MTKSIPIGMSFLISGLLVLVHAVERPDTIAITGATFNPTSNEITITGGVLPTNATECHALMEYRSVGVSE